MPRPIPVSLKTTRKTRSSRNEEVLSIPYGKTKRHDATATRASRKRKATGMTDARFPVFIRSVGISSHHPDVMRNEQFIPSEFSGSRRRHGQGDHRHPLHHENAPKTQAAKLPSSRGEIHQDPAERERFNSIFPLSAANTAMPNGNRLARSNPCFRLPEEEAARETTWGPSVLPMFPENANIPNSVVPPQGMEAAERLNVPGQNNATANPVNAHPRSATNRSAENTATK